MSLVNFINIMLTIYGIAVITQAVMWCLEKLYVRYLLRHERAFLTRWYSKRRFEGACSFPQCYVPCKYCEKGVPADGYSMADSINLGIVRRAP